MSELMNDKSEKWEKVDDAFICDILNNAKPGDKFRTREGVMALYIQRHEGKRMPHEILVFDTHMQDGYVIWYYYPDGRLDYDYDIEGRFLSKKEDKDDIVSAWSINDERVSDAELEKMAEDENPYDVNYDTGFDHWTGFQSGYVQGFKKAKGWED